MSKRFRKTLLLGFVAVASMTSLTGCVKPYNKPEFQTIQANQTAFLIPLIGDTSEQGVFESEALLAETKVATKEVQIPKRWVQTGRMNWKGEWKPSARLITVDRSPVTREWTTGAGTSEKNEAVTTKTKDGIKVILNVNSTALIEEANATKYLYFYNTNPLTQVMDTEIKTMVHSKLIEQVGKVSLDELDAEKVMNQVREEVEEYFSDRGITITALGLASEPVLPEDIQKSMNEKIKAEKAQQTQAIANKTAEDKAKSEAEQMRIRQETFQKTLDMKKLEVQQKAIEKWNGALPNIMGADAMTVLNQK